VKEPPQLLNISKTIWKKNIAQPARAADRPKIWLPLTHTFDQAKSGITKQNKEGDMAQRKQTNAQKCTTETGRTRWYGSSGTPTTHRAMACVIAIVFVATVAGCAHKATRPLNPGRGEGPVSTLVLDNQVSDSPLSGGIDLEVAIDGFSPTDQLNLPMGQTTLQLPVGSHEMIIKARLSTIGNQRVLYYFNPTRVSFDTESKSYTITFSKIGGILSMKPGYGIQYSGWSTEQSAGWPSEVYIANPLFGVLDFLPSAT